MLLIQFRGRFLRKVGHLTILVKMVDSRVLLGSTREVISGAVNSLFWRVWSRRLRTLEYSALTSEAVLIP